jgi:hypothetical protein
MSQNNNSFETKLQDFGQNLGNKLDRAESAVEDSVKKAKDYASDRLDKAKNWVEDKAYDVKEKLSHKNEEDDGRVKENAEATPTNPETSAETPIVVNTDAANVAITSGLAPELVNSTPAETEV